VERWDRAEEGATIIIIIIMVVVVTRKGESEFGLNDFCVNMYLF
jgi:hypothetical protein